jgi:hypothetical protein
MNERIDELALQVGCYTSSRHDPVVPALSGWIINQETLEKFADLIVKECVQTVQDRGGMCGALAANWIEEHFGVIE